MNFFFLNNGGVRGYRYNKKALEGEYSVCDWNRRNVKNAAGTFPNIGITPISGRPNVLKAFFPQEELISAIAMENRPIF